LSKFIDSLTAQLNVFTRMARRNRYSLTGPCRELKNLASRRLNLQMAKRTSCSLMGHELESFRMVVSGQLTSMVGQKQKSLKN